MPTAPTVLSEMSDAQTALDQIPDGAGPFLQVAGGMLRENDITVTPSRNYGTDRAAGKHARRTQRKEPWETEEGEPISPPAQRARRLLRCTGNRSVAAVRC